MDGGMCAPPAQPTPPSPPSLPPIAACTPPQLVQLSESASSLLAARQKLWRRLASWEAFMDQIYHTPVTAVATQLVEGLGVNLSALSKDLGSLSAMHTDEDVCSTSTATPQVGEVVVWLCGGCVVVVV
jgi:hypothetical protein